MPSTPLLFKLFRFDNMASIPWLLKPKLFIKDSCFSNRCSLGLGLPGCAFGVTVPTSIKPKPISSSSGISWPFLSNPAAKPILLPTLSPLIT